jgi:hypothetical protein
VGHVEYGKRLELSLNFQQPAVRQYPLPLPEASWVKENEPAI